MKSYRLLNASLNNKLATKLMPFNVYFFNHFMHEKLVQILTLENAISMFNDLIERSVSKSYQIIASLVILLSLELYFSYDIES